MFTAVYLCYSPASQLWLAPFTRPQLQLELNKTSNRDTRPFCLSFSPRHLKMISRTAMGEKEKNKMLSVTLFFPFPPPIHSGFFLSFHIFTPLFIFPVQHRGGSAHRTSIYPPTRTSYPCKEATLGVFLLLSLPLSLFLQKNCAFYVMEACCSLWAQGCGFGFGPGPHSVEKHRAICLFSTLTMKQW